MPLGGLFPGSRHCRRDQARKSSGQHPRTSSSAISPITVEDAIRFRPRFGRFVPVFGTRIESKKTTRYNWEFSSSLGLWGGIGNPSRPEDTGMARDRKLAGPDAWSTRSGRWRTSRQARARAAERWNATPGVQRTGITRNNGPGSDISICRAAA